VGDPASSLVGALKAGEMPIPGVVGRKWGKRELPDVPKCPILEACTGDTNTGVSSVLEEHLCP